MEGVSPEVIENARVVLRRKCFLYEKKDIRTYAVEGAWVDDYWRDNSPLRRKRSSPVIVIEGADSRVIRAAQVLELPFER